MKQIKLEVGKTYRSRKGEEVKIVRKVSAEEYPYRGSNNEWYDESGKWSYYSEEYPKDLIEEFPGTRHTFGLDPEALTAIRYTFDIPDGMKKGTVSQEGNRIIVEMVPEDVETPKAGDVMISDWGGVYILKEVKSDDTHIYFVMLGKNGHLFYWSSCFSGRPATTEEAQPLFDALKKEGKRWNPETMEVEEIPEIDRIREWMDMNIKCGGEVVDIAEIIERYLKYREGEK